MAILREMVGQKVIDGFKGVIDFYYYMGIPCARMWPRKPGEPRILAVQLTGQIFKHAAQIFPQISQSVRDAYQEMAGSTDLTWKDMFYRGYISGSLRYFFAPDELEDS